MNSPSSAGQDLFIGELQTIDTASAVAQLDMARLVSVRQAGDTALASAGTVGSLVKMKVGELFLIASIREIKTASPGAAHAETALEFIGEGVQSAGAGLQQFKRGISRYPFPGDPLYAVTHDDLMHIYSADDKVTIRVGTVFPSNDIPATLNIDAMLGRHFAVMGSSGSGKSSFMSLVLNRMMERLPNGHIVLFDTHGEYAPAFAGRSLQLNTENLQLPYWLMNFEEHAEIFITAEGEAGEIDRDILAKCLLKARTRNNLSIPVSKITVDSPIPYLLGDLMSIVETEMGKLEKSAGTTNYMRLKFKIQEISNDPRYGFMFNRNLISDSMETFLSDILRLPPNGAPMTIIDISGIPSEIVKVVVSLVARLTFDFSIWAKHDATVPILLVCEEAQQYLPSDRSGAVTSVQKILQRIAKEGRKHGISLGLVSQRPSDLSEGVLSQCGTIMTMRMSTERDQQFIRSAMPEWSKSLLDAVPGLRNQECIICGEGVSLPIRVRIDRLEKERLPASADPVFSTAWQTVGGESALLRSSIQRWRNQGMDADAPASGGFSADLPASDYLLR